MTYLLLVTPALLLGAARYAAGQQYLSAPDGADGVTQTIYIPDPQSSAEDTAQALPQTPPGETSPRDGEKPLSASRTEQDKNAKTSAQKVKTPPKKEPTVTQPGKFVPFFPVGNAAYRNETESQEYLLSSPSIFPGVGLRPRRSHGGRKGPHRPGKPGYVKPGGSHAGMHRPGIPPPPSPVPGRDPRLDAPPSGYKPVTHKPSSGHGGRPMGGPTGTHHPKPQGPRPR